MSHSCTLTACSSSPCLHDGTCILDSSYAYRCACLGGYTGQRCENGELPHDRAVNTLIFCVWGLLHSCGKRKSSLVNHREKQVFTVCTLGITSISHGIWEACLNILTRMKLQSQEANKFIGSQFESFLPWNWTHLAMRNPRHQSTSCMLLLPKGRQWFTVTRERSAVWAAFRPAVFSIRADPATVLVNQHF